MEFKQIEKMRRKLNLSIISFLISTLSPMKENIDLFEHLVLAGVNSVQCVLSLQSKNLTELGQRRNFFEEMNKRKG